MKTLPILLFSIFISFNSYGEWVKVSKNSSGNTHYIDTDTIREHGGYVYYWNLTDLLKPDKDGDMSWKTYFQGDCGVNRYKGLSYIFYKQPMGRGSGETYNPPNSEWKYPSPGSVGGTKLKYVCDYVE